MEKPIFYVARTSLVSLMSPPLHPEPALLDLAQAKHERAWMEKDFTRSFWNELAQARLDLLILDFIDERFDLLEMSTPAGSGYKLRVQEFDQEKSRLAALGYRTLRRHSELIAILWRRSAKLFLDRMRREHPGVRIALHAAPLLNSFEDGKPSANTDWWVREADYVTAFKGMLEVYERTILSLDSSVIALSVDPAYRHLRRGHIWGEAPYHYADAYYVKLVDQIRKLPRDA